MDHLDHGALFDEHMADEFVLRDVDATMATMTEDPVVLHVPTSIGGRGVHDVRRFYANHFIGRFPDDFTPTPLSRTIGDDRLVDEMIISFTHTCEVPIFLPGVEPTGRRLRFPLVAVVCFVDGKVASEHLYWDQASVLVQAGLLDAGALPARGVEQAAALEADQPDNEILRTVVTSSGTPNDSRTPRWLGGANRLAARISRSSRRG